MGRHFLYAARVAVRASLTVLLVLALSTLAAFAGFVPAAALAVGIFALVNAPLPRAAALRHALRWGR